MKIQDQIAVVTGGASGLGLATVEALKASRVRVITWDMQVTSDDPESFVCDVTDEMAVKNALSQTIEQYGVPRILIHCAGIAPGGRLVGKDGVLAFDVFKKVIDVNLNGTFNVLRYFAEKMMSLPALDDGERGVIITTASIAAFEGQIGQVAYSASKGGVVAMTLPIARELAQFGIRVNTIAPGVMETPLMANMPDAVRESLSVTVPFPKRLGLPKEFAHLAIHCCENTYLNGEVIRLDGALRMSPK
jgi:NAD(P)-dependent dehydrogenase (short-subunit alcohol dehydrogenase family)